MLPSIEMVRSLLSKTKLSTRWQDVITVILYGQVRLLHRPCMQPQAKCRYDLEDGIEIRAPLARKGLVEAFPRQTGIQGDLGHSLGPRNGAEGLGDKGSIIPACGNYRRLIAPPSLVQDPRLVLCP